MRVRLRVAVALLAAALLPLGARAQDVLDPTAAARQLRAERPQALAPRPASGLDHDAGDVVILEHDGSNYDKLDGSGQVNLAPRAALARRFYQAHGDNYDFLVVFTNFEFASPGALAFHVEIRNDTRGIGRPPLDIGEVMGSPSRLKGYIDMAALSRYRRDGMSLDPSQPGFGATLGVVAHEVGHQWLSRVKFRDAFGHDSLDLIGPEEVHWSYLLDSDASLMFGADWVPSGNGHFTAARVRDTYSSLDLYLMGLIEAARTPPFTLLRAPAIDRHGIPAEGERVAAAAETVTVDQVIAAEGPRSPGSRDAQKDFRIGFIFLTAQGETPAPEDLAAVERVRAAFADYFFAKTRGLAVADTTLAEAPDEPPAPAPDVDRAVQWLLARQAADGRWADAPATAVRDTAAAIEALDPLPEATSAVARARAWLRPLLPATLDHAARRAIALTEPALPPAERAALIEGVLADAAPEGGFGIVAGYAPDALDTALGLRALAALKATETAAPAQAVAAVSVLRDPSGGFPVVSGGPVSTVVTAEAVVALSQWPDLPAAQALVPAAVAALLGRRNPDGGFGESPSTPYATALALRALLSANAPPAAVNPPTAWLQGHQHGDGSWTGGVYPTALTVAALRESAGANLTVPQDGLRLEPATPTEGQVVAVSARVRNAGRTAAPSQHVRLFDGDPALGRVVGETTLGPLGPGQEGPVAFDFDTTDRPGQRTLYVVADALGEVRETREDDNTGSRSLTVTGLLPNLEVTPFDVTIAPNPPEDGETATIAVTVRNTGPRGAGATRLDATLGDPRAGGLPIGRVAVPALAPGQQATVSVPWNTLGRRGPHEVAVRADADFAVSESDETDNEAVVPVTVSGPLPPGPDLAVAAVRGRPGRLLTLPQAQAVDVLVQNLGRDPAVSTVALRDAGGALIGQQPVTLAARSAQVLTFELSLDAPGSRTFVAVADPDDTLAETREDNNSGSFTLVDGGDTVDVELPAGGVTATPAELRAGDTLTVAALVHNRGTAPLFDVPVLLAHAAPGGPVELARRVVSLPPGASTTLTFVWAASIVGDPVPLAVIADPFGVLDELSETNNRRDLAVRVQPSTLPNLRVSGADIHFQPDPPLEGGAAVVSVVVRNTGSVAAGPFDVRFFRGNPDDGGTLIGGATVLGVEGGSAVTAGVTWPAVDTRGIAGIFAVADPDGAVAEYDETDNRAFRPVSVLSLPDLVLTSADVTLAPGFPHDGQAITVTARVRNLGQQPAPASTLRAWEGEPGGGTVIGTVPVPALAPLESAEVALDWTPAAPPGEVTLSVVADADAAVRESDEGNNAARRTVVIQDADLYLTQPSFSPNGDGVQDTTTLAWRATSAVTVVVSDSQGRRVRTLAEGAPAQGAAVWDGRDGRGHVLWDGTYFITVEGPDHVALGRTTVTLDTNRSPIHDAAGTGLVTLRTPTCALPMVLGPAWMPAEDEALFVVPASTPEAAAGLVRVTADGQWSYVGGGPDPWYEQDPHDPSGARTFISDAAVSPDGREALLVDGAGGLLSVDLQTGARRPIATGAFRAAWSPDGRWIALGNRVVDRSGASEVGLPFAALSWSPDGDFLTNGRRVVRRDGSGERELPLPVSDPVDETRWLDDGRIFVRTLRNSGFSDEDSAAHGFLIDPETDAVTELPWVPHIPPAASLALTPNGARAAYRAEGPANVVREDGSEVRLTDPGPTGAGFAVSPHSRVASYTANGQGGSGATCVGPPEEVFVLSSLQNMTLDLQLARLPANNGLIVRGTASDRDLEYHQLDYATTDAPDVWHPIGPASGIPVVDDVLAVWVPPGPGTYVVRLSARDRAGNSASTSRVAAWDRVPAIANVAQSERLISPTGDGVKDAVQFSYLVIEPTRVDVAIAGPLTAGQTPPVVRRMEFEHPTTGPAAFDWDGRDATGGVVPDGRYTVTVNGLPFTVDVDSTPPDIAWSYQDLRSEPRTPPVEPGSVAADRHWHIVDPHLAGWTRRSTFFVDEGREPVYEPERDADGQIIYVNGVPKVKYDGLHAADTVGTDTSVEQGATDPATVLTATDHAGNRSSITIAPVPERLFLLSARDEFDLVIGAPIDRIPHAFKGRVVFALGETLRATPPNAPPTLHFEYRGAGALDWTAAPAFEGTGWSVDFAQLGLAAAAVYQGRFRAEGPAPASSEDFSFTLCGVTGALSVSEAPIAETQLSVYTAFVSASSPAEPIADVVLRARGPNGFTTDAVMERQPDGSFRKTVIGPASRCGPGRMTFQAGIYGASGKQYGNAPPCRRLLDVLPPRTANCTESALWQKFPFCAASPTEAYIGIDLLDVADGLLTVEAQGNTIGSFQVLGGQAPPDVAVDAGALSEGRVMITARHPDGSGILVAGPATDADVYVTPSAFADHAPLIDRTLPAATVLKPDELGRLCTTVEDNREVARITLAIHEQGNAVQLGAAAFQPEGGAWKAMDVVGGLGIRLPTTEPAPVRWAVTDVPDGTYTVRVPLCDRAGHRTQVERRLALSRAPVRIPLALSRPLFSPNGDGRADETIATVTLATAMTLTVEVYRGGTELVRRLVTDQAYEAGPQVFAWDGRDGAGQIVADGRYMFVVRSRDECAITGRAQADVEVDTQAPAAAIAAPTPGQAVAVGVDVRGQADDLHLRSFELAFGEGAAPTQWIPFASGTNGVSGPSGFLGRWNTPQQEGPYVLRLQVTDKAENTSVVTVPVSVAPSALLDRLTVAPAFSPNGDGHGDAAAIEYVLRTSATVTVTVRDAQDTVVRTLVPAALEPAGTHVLAWDGNVDGGAPAPEGDYTVHVHAEAPPTPAEDASGAVVLDRLPPVVSVTSPQAGAVVAAGEPVRGTVADPRLAFYAVTLRAADAPPIEIARGTSSATDAPLAVLPALTDGPLVLAVTAEDVAGNRTVVETAVLADTLSPVARLIAPGEVVPRGATPVVLTGTATDANLREYVLEFGAGTEPSTFVEFARGTVAVPSGTLSQWNVAGLTDGVYTLRLTVTDRAGQSSEAGVRVTLDGTAPRAVLTTPAPGAFLRAPSEVRGSAGDAHLQRWSVEMAPGTAEQAHQWSPLAEGTEDVEDAALATVDPIPPDGVHTVRLTVRDAAGNVSRATRTFTVDTVPPGAVAALQAEPVRTASSVDVRLTWSAVAAPDLAGYVVTRDGVALTPEPLAALQFVDAAPDEGSYRYAVRAVDRAGNAGGAAEATLRLDRTPPLVALDRPSSGQFVSGAVDVRGTAHSADFREYRLLVGAGEQPASWSVVQRSSIPVASAHLGTWTAVGAGPYVLALEGEDTSGNVARAAVTVLVDNVAPAPPVLDAVAPQPAPDALGVTWQPSPDTDVLGYLVYRDGRLANATGVVIGDLRPYLVPPPTYVDAALPDGERCYRVVAMDHAGNLSPPSNTLCRTLDNRRPHAVVVAPPDGTRFEFPVRVLAEVADTDVVAVQFELKGHAEAEWQPLGAADAQAPFEVTLDPATLAPGAYDLRARARDAGGDDPSPVSVTVTYGDTTAPAAPRDLVARVDGTQVLLTWAANAEPDLAGYVVWRGDERLTPAPVTAPTFLDTVPATGSYTYRVSATDGDGNESGLSAPALALVYQPALEPAFPVTDQAVASLPGLGARAQTTIEIRRDNTMIATTTVAADGPFTVPAVPLAAGPNILTARGVDAAGNRSIDSAEVVLVSNEPPAAVTALEAAVTDHAVDLTWAAVADADLFGYGVRRDGHDVTTVAAQTAAASITATSVAGAGFEAARAFDGDPGTLWLADPSDRTPAWTVTFPQPVLVHTVRLAFPSLPAAYRVEVGWQGRFLPIARVRGTASAVVEHVLPAPFATDAVRVVLDGQPAGLAEVAVDVLSLVPAGTGAFHDDAVADGQHDYEVRAVDVYGAAGPAALRRVPVGDVTPPDAPVNLAAQVEGADVALAWAPSPEADVTHYLVLRDGMEVATTIAPQYRDVALPNGTYEYVVVAVDAAGNRSAGSAPVVATVAVAPPAPPALSATALANGAVRLTWTHAGAARFEIHFAAAGGGPFAPLAQTGDTRTYVDGSAPSGQARFYVVRAADARETLSGPSNVADATPLRTAPPAPPVLLRPTDADHPLPWPASATALDGRALSGALVGVSVGGTLRTVTEAGPPFQPWATEALAGPVTSLVASLDAHHLAYSPAAAPGILQWRDLETLAQGEIAHPGSSALRARAFSPDGRRLAYTARVCDAVSCHDALFAADLDGGDATPLGAGDGDVTGADWSDDGAAVAFASTEAGACAILVRRLDEAAPRTLAMALRCGPLRLAPAGAQVAATVLPDGGATEELWSVDVATGEVTVLATNVWEHSRPSWSHDGARVAYTAQAAGGLRARVVELATRDRFDLADPSHSTLDPQFDPDGGWLTLTALRGTPSGPERVLVSENLEDGRRVEVAAALGAGAWPLHSWLSRSTLAVALPDRVVFLGAEGAFHVGDVRLAPGTNTITSEATDAVEGLTSAPSRAITLEVAPGPFADLVVAPEALATYPDIPGVGQDTLVKARVDNRGPASAGNVRVLLGIKDADGAVRLSHEAEVSVLPSGSSAWVSAFWTPLQPGTYGLHAQADPEDSVAELREDNNEATRGVLVAPQAGVIVTVSADRAEYGPNAPALVTVRVTNAGPDFAGTLVTSVEGTGVAAVIDTRPVALAYGQSSTFALPWNTGTTYAGLYAFVTRASGAAGGGEGRQPFRIRADVNVDVRLLPVQASVAEGQPAAFTVRVSNRSVNAILDGTAAHLAIVPAAGGPPAFSTSSPVPSLLPGGTWEGTLTWPAAGPAGDYVATGEVRDGAATLASHSAPLQVRGTVPVAGTLAVPAHVVAGDAVTAEATITNTGTLALAGEPFEVALLDGATGAVLRRAAFTADLAAGERQQRVVTLPGGVLPAGPYPVVLRATRFALTLDRATVRVHGPLTAPSIDAPANGTRVTTAHPLLVVLNAGAPAGTTPTYEFQLFADPALTVPVPGAAGVPQTPVRTSWRVAIALGEDKTYYWRARAADAVALSPWTAIGSFTVDAVNHAPDAPVPDSPEAGARVATVLPELVVRNARDVDRDVLLYDFRVADDAAMSDVVASVAGVPEGAGFTSWTVPEPLAEDGTYFWSARARDATHTSPWSVPSAFVVDATNQGPSAPQLLRPVGGAAVATLQPELAVANATDPEGDVLRYRFELDVVPTFDSEQLQVSPLLPETAGETTWTPPLPLDDNTLHYWRAAAHDGHTSGVFAGSTFFVNLANDPPSAPVALSPTTGMVVGTATPTLRLRNAVDVDRDPLTYEFEVTDEGGATVLAAQDGVPSGATESEWTVSPPLPENVHARWRARAHDPAVAGPWSEPQSFRVNAVAEPPTPPTLAAPAEGAVVEVPRPTLSVHNASSPDEHPLTYTFELYALDGDGNETLVERAQGIAEGVDQTSWTPAQDLADGSYRWRAAAVDPVQPGPWMSTARFTVLVDRPPQPPTALQAVAGDAQVRLTWNAVPEPDVVGYRVLRGTVSGGPYMPVATVPAPAFTDTGLANGVTVFYVVTALDAHFESPYSGEVAATPRPAVLAVELGLTPGALRGECLLGGPCAAGCPQWVYATIELPFGMPPETIDRATIRLGGTVAPDPDYAQVVDSDGDGQPELEQRFALEGLAALLHVGANTVSISGRADGSDFRGSAALDVAPLHVVMGVGPRVLKKSEPNASLRFVARLNLDACVAAAEVVPGSVRLNGVVAPLSVNVEGVTLIGVQFPLSTVVEILPVGEAVEVHITGNIRAVGFAGTASVRVLP